MVELLELREFNKKKVICKAEQWGDFGCPKQRVQVLFNRFMANLQESSLLLTG